MTPEQLSAANATLRTKTPLEITRWALAQAPGRALVSTNFRPYEAAILHLAVQAQPDIPVLWVDHGYNRPRLTATPRNSGRGSGSTSSPTCPASRRAPRRVHGPIPDTTDEEGLKRSAPR
jgi:phosphoadenosine phosphosulfate reductase